MIQQTLFPRKYSEQIFSQGKSRSLPWLSFVCFLLVNLNTTASAQVIRDNTLPNNSDPLTDGNMIKISGGTTVGSNLFHSFEQFSLSTGNTAWFNNASIIQNIIGRVTGDSVSNIDGLIRANGTANLFLINPNGIVFGENSALDVGGSFVGSTADSLKFADNSEFSAVDPQAPPLLEVSIPVGLQYGNSNGELVVQGSGNQLQFNRDFTVDKSSRPTGLEVDEGQTLALVGGNVFLDGGNLTAETGRIELGSVADHQFVRFNLTESGLNFDYTEVSNFKNINLANASSLEVSGNGAGDVQVQGKEVIITDGSAILADTVGDSNGGTLQINGSELLVVAGTSLDLPFISRLSTDVATGATGNGGDIELNSANLIIADGAQIISSSYGDGDTGNIKVDADYVELFGGSPILNNSSGLFTLVFGAGNGGDIEIDANNTLVAGGAQAATLTFGNGDGGDLLAKANQIELVGTSPGGNASSLLANVESGAIGNGGTLTIDTKSLLIADGSQVAMSTFGDGDVGILDVKAEEIQLTGTSSSGIRSGLFNNVESAATGKGGQIKIDTNKLNISDGAQVSALTLGDGVGGKISVEADEIEISGGVLQSPSGFQSTVASSAKGDGGRLEIRTGNLKVIDGGQIAVSTAGIGAGGELEIEADEIELIGRSEFGASGIFGNAIIGTGNGGNLKIDTNSLTILDGATISASNFSSRNIDIPPGEGKAGSVEINANAVKLDATSANAPSSITASTYNNGGGNINLNIAGDITISNNSEIDADTRGDADGGNINLTADNLKLNSQGRVSVNSSGSGRAGNISIRANNLNAQRGKITATSENSGGGNIHLATDFIFLNNSELSSSIFNGTGGGGNLAIDSNYIIAQDNSNIIAKADRGDGGNIDITTKVFLLTADSLVDASSEFGVDGVVDINSPDTEQQIDVGQLSAKVTDPTALIAAVCPKDKTNALSNTGKGGLAENPSQHLRGESVWEDLRSFVDVPTVDNLSRPAHGKEIIEARAWNINDEGNVQLLSYMPTQHKPDYWALFNQCRK
ncbi:MAG: filamentous hemagglutinin N-terminal domain-containing protein [Waterburya sp.]